MVRWLGDTQDDALDRVLLFMVGAFAGLPCPTVRDISAWTGLSARAVGWIFQHRGRIEKQAEADETKTYGGVPWWSREPATTDGAAPDPTKARHPKPSPDPLAGRP